MTGREYAELRKSLGLTQVELAAAVGVAPSTVSAREQQPDKDIPDEAKLAIESVAVDVRADRADW